MAQTQDEIAMAEGTVNAKRGCSSIYSTSQKKQPGQTCWRWGGSQRAARGVAILMIFDQKCQKGPKSLHIVAQNDIRISFFSLFSFKF